MYVEDFSDCKSEDDFSRVFSLREELANNVFEKYINIDNDSIQKLSSFDGRLLSIHDYAKIIYLKQELMSIDEDSSSAYAMTLAFWVNGLIDNMQWYKEPDQNSLEDFFSF
jgi:hypothetical protein